MAIDVLPLGLLVHPLQPWSSSLQASAQLLSGKYFVDSSAGSAARQPNLNCQLSSSLQGRSVSVSRVVLKQPSTGYVSSSLTMVQMKTSAASRSTWQTPSTHAAERPFFTAHANTSLNSSPGCSGVIPVLESYALAVTALGRQPVSSKGTPWSDSVFVGTAGAY